MPREGTREPVRAFLAAVDRRSPVDALLVQVDAAVSAGSGIAESEHGAAMDVVAALAEPMRRRGCGTVMLVSGLAGQRATSDPQPVLATRSALVEHGAALRRRLAADGIAVTIVVPGAVALRCAARLDAPFIAELGAERVGEAIGSGLRRNREVISVPGSAVAARRAIRAFFRNLRHTVRDWVRPVINAEPEAQPIPLADALSSGGRDVRADRGL